MKFLNFLNIFRTVEKISEDAKEVKLSSLDFKKVLAILLVVAVMVLIFFTNSESEVALHATTKFISFIEHLIQ